MLGQEAEPEQSSQQAGSIPTLARLLGPGAPHRIWPPCVWVPHRKHVQTTADTGKLLSRYHLSPILTSREVSKGTENLASSTGGSPHWRKFCPQVLFSGFGRRPLLREWQKHSRHPPNLPVSFCYNAPSKTQSLITQIGMSLAHQPKVPRVGGRA